jgi:hypothetical protein
MEQEHNMNQNKMPDAIADRLVKDVQKRLNNSPVDTRRWSKQRRFDEYLALAKHERELRDLYQSVKLIGTIYKKSKVDEEDLIATWYRGGLRDRVIELVGHSALRTTDTSLTGMRAYDIVYQTLIDLLYEPDLFDDCKEPEPKLVVRRASDLMNAPMVTSRREGDDLVLEKWFNPEAIR